jgi:hypothetical protein
VNLVKGEALVFPKTGKPFDPAQIPKAVKDAGFSATEVLVEAEGIMAKRDAQLQFDIPGLNHPFALSGGPKMEALAARTELIGKKVRVTGKLQLGHAQLPPSLTIESFQSVP